MSDQLPHKPFFSGQFSLGNIVTLIGGIVAFSVAWGGLDSHVSKNSDAVTTAINRVEEGIDRIRMNEIAITRQEERTNSILTGISRIEGQLRRMDEKFTDRKIERKFTDRKIERYQP